MIAYPPTEAQLTSEQLYRRELASLPDAKALSQQEQEAYIVRARAGDRQAREIVITSLLHRIAAYCRTYYQAHSWASPQLCYLDLVQAGNLAVLEYVDQVLQSDHDNPYAYLTVAAYGAVRTYARRYSSLIVTPSTLDACPVPVASLDAPVSEEGEGTLADLVAETVASETETLQAATPIIDYGLLYEGIDALGEVGRAVVVQYYGLFGRAPTSLQELDQTMFHRENQASRTHMRALDRLHQLLRNAYPQFPPSLSRPRRQPPGAMAGRLLEGQQARLEQAHALLVARGEKVSVERLHKAAHVGKPVARTYLHQWEVEHPQETAEHRLTRAYQELQAECGARISAERLAQRARVCYPIASGYLQDLQERRGPQQSQEERLSQAYQQMKAQGETITAAVLRQRSHVGSHKARAWLTAQRLAEGCCQHGKSAAQ